MTTTASVDRVLAELAPVLGDRIGRSEDERRHHGTDEGWHAPVAPDAVVYPRTTEEVAVIVETCAGHGVPVIPFGAGTSLEGGVAAIRGGVSVDLNGMDRIVEVNDADLDCTVEAGVRRIALNDHLGPRGLFFPIDPGADATIGGMAATRASGTNAVRYGTMRDNVLAVTAVMADGSIARTASRSRKSSAGYDLTRLLVGSEGTLGIMTEITLRLYGIPQVIAAAVCPFATLEGAVDTVIETIQLGIPVARMELLDRLQVAASNAYSGLDLDEVPTLFLEFHGTEASVAEQVAQVKAIAVDHGAARWDDTTDQAERSRLWKARHDAYYACLATRPGARGMPTDVCVPISRLADVMAATRVDFDRSGLWVPIVGHVGDGNFHCIFVLDPDDPDEVATFRAAHHRLVTRALEARWYLHRGARDRLRQARIHGGRARARHRGGDASHQDRPRSPRDPQPGQGRARLIPLPSPGAQRRRVTTPLALDRGSNQMRSERRSASVNSLARASPPTARRPRLGRNASLGVTLVEDGSSPVRRLRPVPTTVS